MAIFAACKRLFNETLKGKIDRFVSIDGDGLGITYIGTGSMRYRVTFKGPGGHSFGSFGTVNPIHALGRAIARIADFQVPTAPRTTFNVGRVGGGTSINAIASEAWMEVDLRSSERSDSPLARGSVSARPFRMPPPPENARWRSQALTVTIEVVGVRPAGRASADFTDRAGGDLGDEGTRHSRVVFRRLDRFEPADQPRYSGHHDRHRRARVRRAHRRRDVRYHRRMEGDSARRCSLAVAARATL